MRWWLLALCLAGCGFHAEGGDLGAPDGGADRAVPDGGADLATDGGADLAGAASCPLPELMVAVTSSASGGHGELLRLPLAGGPDGGCPPLTASGTLDPTVHAIAWIPPDGVAAAGDNNGLVVLDAATDQVRFQQPVSAPNYVVDVFPLTGSETLVGLGLNVTSPSFQIDRLRIYRDGNAPVYDWLLNGTQQPIGNVFGVTARPNRPGHLFTLDAYTTPSGATDFDPVAMTTAAYAAYPSGAKLETISAVASAGLLRIAWRDDNAGGLRAVRDDGSGPVSVGPLSCPSCMMVDGVPDPTDPNGYFAICDMSTVVHVSAVSSGCPTVLDVSNLPSGLDHFTRLAIAN